jgi:hypothetical protein
MRSVAVLRMTSKAKGSAFETTCRRYGNPKGERLDENTRTQLRIEQPEEFAVRFAGAVACDGSRPFVAGRN